MSNLETKTNTLNPTFTVQTIDNLYIVDFFNTSKSFKTIQGLQNFKAALEKAGYIHQAVEIDLGQSEDVFNDSILDLIFY